MNSIFILLLQSNNSNSIEWHPTLKPMAAESDLEGMYKVESRKNKMEVKEKTRHLTGIRKFICQGLELGNLIFI